MQSIGDDNRTIADLRSLKSQRSSRAPRIARAIGILESATSSRVRNAAALALADLRAHDAKERLIDLLLRADTAGARGTLLFALEQLGADVPLPTLVRIIMEDAYEAREEALSFIETGRIEYTPEDLAHCENMLEGASAAADGERLQAFRRALRYLQSKHHHDG
jgi:HEAT repeat protein